MKEDNKIDPLDMIAAIMPGGVELQEAVGQRRFVASETLPIAGLEWQYGRGDQYEVSPKEYLTSLGFEFGKEADDLFINVTLPEGWKLEPTDHSMWSHLVDGKGRQRAGIFYKAAFYDRSADFNLMQRFNRGEIFEGNEGYVEGAIKYYVSDMDKFVYTTKEYTYEEKYEGNYWDIGTTAQKDTDAWLEGHYPDWQNPMAYWED